MLRHFSILPPSLVLALLSLSGGQVGAGEIDWRDDYRLARYESLESGRPLLIEFTTDRCSWCRKLEATTFQDGIVSRLICDRFIPLRVHVKKNPALAEALQVQGCPTVVIADSTGKILRRLDGYVDATTMQLELQRCMAASAGIQRASFTQPATPTAQPTVTRPKSRFAAWLAGWKN